MGTTIEWAVIDSIGRVTICADEQAARDYQAEHGGRVAARQVYEDIIPADEAVARAKDEERSRDKEQPE